MTYRSYICDDCGFSSEEKPGVYICPKCNNKMRIAKPSGAFGGGDNTRTDGKLLLYILFFIFVGAILVGLLNIFGVVLFVVLFYFFRKFLNSSIRDKAIPVGQQDVIVEDKVEVIPGKFCRNCGHELSSDTKFCPNCGEKVLFK